MHVTPLTASLWVKSSRRPALAPCHTPGPGWDVNVTPVKTSELRIETENRHGRLTGGKRGVGRRCRGAAGRDGCLVDLLQEADQVAARDSKLQGGAAPISTVPGERAQDLFALHHVHLAA